MKIILDLEPAELLKLVNEHQLYSKEGALFGAILIATKFKSLKIRSALACVDSKPIGVCILKHNNWLMVFVKPEYRHQGIGHELVDIVLKLIGRRRLFVWAMPGEHEELSQKFWHKHQVLIDNDGAIPVSTQIFEDFQAGRIDMRYLSAMSFLNRQLEVKYITQEQYDQEVAIETKRVRRRYERNNNGIQATRNPKDPNAQADEPDQPNGAVSGHPQ